MKLVVKNGQLVDPAHGVDRVADILIEDGKIRDIGTFEANGEASLDATGLVVAPGFFDIHVHLREPGTE